MRACVQAYKSQTGASLFTLAAEARESRKQRIAQTHLTSKASSLIEVFRGSNVCAEKGTVRVLYI